MAASLRRLATAATVAFGWQAAVALAHGGGLNADGCHTNRQSGDYHCHRAHSAVDAAPRATNPGAASPGRSGFLAGPPTTRPGPGPTCFVGPRGGTYTITASGRKNYGGC